MDPKTQSFIEDVVRVQVCALFLSKKFPEMQTRVQMRLAKRDYLMLLKALHFPSTFWCAFRFFVVARPLSVILVLRAMFQSPCNAGLCQLPITHAQKV